MYDHVTDPDVKKTLETYKPLMDALKKQPLDLSTYRVEKHWGYEVWLDVNEHYAYKLIHMKQGCRCSLQSHEKKVEANYIIAGEAEVLLENDAGEMVSTIYKVGEGWSVPVGKKHRVIAKTDYTALEVSTPHLDDIIRYADDAGRGSGTVQSEHKGNAI
jgi:mannose-6-phosphate isomerase-like protein (cupin superfamily)